MVNKQQKSPKGTNYSIKVNKLLRKVKPYTALVSCSLNVKVKLIIQTRDPEPFVLSFFLFLFFSFFFLKESFQDSIQCHHLAKVVLALQKISIKILSKLFFFHNSRMDLTISIGDSSLR